MDKFLLHTILFACFSCFSLVGASISYAQDDDNLQYADSTFSLSDFLELVAAYHPISKQADLIRDNATGQIVEAKGSFDPKIEGDGRTKTFDGKDYYDVGKAQLKIPLWLIDLKTGVEYGRGDFASSESITPAEGLFFVGADIPLGRDLWTDKRRTDLRKARLLDDMAEAERQKERAKLIKDAVKSYAAWSSAYSQYEQYQLFHLNAERSLDFVIRLQINGEYSAVDSLEAALELQSRSVLLQEGAMMLEQQRLMLSTFLWSPEGTPLMVPESIRPDISIASFTNPVETLLPNETDWQVALHPEFRKNDLKLRSLGYDLNFARSRLLPDIKLSLTPILDYREDAIRNLQLQPDQASKAAITVNMPLFLRKERGKLQQTNVKVRDQEFLLDQLSLELDRMAESRLVALSQMLRMHEAQVGVVRAARELAAAERRKFQLGESSVFLINKREAYVFESALKQIALEEKILGGYAELLEAQGRLWQQEGLYFPLMQIN